MFVYDELQAHREVLMNTDTIPQFLGKVKAKPFKGNKKRVSTPLEKSSFRANHNLEISCSLGEIAEARRDSSAQVTADLLKFSADPKANGELTNLIDKKGRRYDSPQALINASTRLDINYANKTARRHQKTIYEAFLDELANVIKNGWDISFLTPTFPNLLGVGFTDNDRFQTRFWELFLQTTIFSEFFYAGYFKTEWTIAEDFDLNKTGINYHGHVLCINHKPFAEGETSALENRLAKMKKDKRYTAEEKRLIRDTLKLVRAITECMKKAHLEIFGKPLKVKTKSGRVRMTFQNVNLDEVKSYDFDESKKGVFWEIAKTVNYTGKANSFRNLPPELLLEAKNVFDNKRLINPFGAFRKQVERKSATSQPLVNQPTKQSQICAKQIANPLFDNTLRGEFESLKSYGKRLCFQGLRQTWLKYLEVNKDLIIAKKRDALLERFPNAIFTDLSGAKYYGWKARKGLKQQEKEKRAGYNPALDMVHIFKRYEKLYYETTHHPTEEYYSENAY